MGKRIFLIDFDCTITHNDTTDELMKIYNQDMLEDYQRKFRSGELTSPISRRNFPSIRMQATALG